MRVVTIYWKATRTINNNSKKKQSDNNSGAFSWLKVKELQGERVQKCLVQIKIQRQKRILKSYVMKEKSGFNWQNRSFSIGAQ